VTVQLPPNVLNVSINVNYGNYQYDVTSKVLLKLLGQAQEFRRYRVHSHRCVLFIRSCGVARQVLKWDINRVPKDRVVALSGNIMLQPGYGPNVQRQGWRQHAHAILLDKLVFPHASQDQGGRQPDRQRRLPDQPVRHLRP